MQGIQGHGKSNDPTLSQARVPSLLCKYVLDITSSDVRYNLVQTLLQCRVARHAFHVVGASQALEKMLLDPANELADLSKLRTSPFA
jgi:hypothetical protein